MAPEPGAHSGRHRAGGRRPSKVDKARSRAGQGALSRSVRVPAARHFHPGRLRADGVGTSLRCLVLVPGPDWIAVDVDSGALLRAPLESGVADVAQPDTGSGEGGAAGAAGRAAEAESHLRRWPDRSLSAVELTLGAPCDPPDPARPEAVVLAGEPVLLGEPRRRTTRRLLHKLTTKASNQPLLGTLGPSISYRDLDGTRPSIVIVAPQVRPRFGVGPAGPWCQFLLGGRRHTMPCSEGAIPDASATGHGTKLLVVALGAPHRGQVPKVVLGALPIGR